MDEDLVNSINDASNSGTTAQAPTAPPVQPQPAPSPAPAFASVGSPKPAKKTPVSTIILAILAILGIGAAIVFSYLYFTKTPSGNAPESNAVTSSEDETEVTDEALKLEIIKKVNNLFGLRGEETSLQVSKLNYEDVSLFNTGAMSQEYSIYTTIDSIDSTQFLPLTEEAAISVRAQLEGYGYDDLSTESITTVSSDIVAAKFKELFGYEYDKSFYVSGEYIYNPENSFYYKCPDDYVDSFSTRFYYIDSITETNSSIYAYVSGAYLDPSEGKVYCGVFDPLLDSATTPEECASYSEGETFKLDASNSSNYATARFEFSKQPDGSRPFLFTRPVSN